MNLSLVVPKLPNKLHVCLVLFTLIEVVQIFRKEKFMKKDLTKPRSNRKVSLAKVNYLVKLFANESTQNNGTSACQNNAAPRCKNSGCRSI